jgi:cytochrome c553
MPVMKPRPSPTLAAALAVTAWSAWATSPAELTAEYAQAAQRPALPAQGQAFFNTRHGREWSCASCHGAPPTRPGQHRSTGKSIAPLAPAFEPSRFTDAAKAEKWFRRNCKDVLGRECTAGEKADVLAWLSSLKP